MSVTLTVIKDGCSSHCVALWWTGHSSRLQPRRFPETSCLLPFICSYVKNVPSKQPLSAASAALCLAVFTASRSFFLGHLSVAVPLIFYNHFNLSCTSRLFVHRHRSVLALESMENKEQLKTFLLCFFLCQERFMAPHSPFKGCSHSIVLKPSIIILCSSLNPPLSRICRSSYSPLLRQ